MLDDEDIEYIIKRCDTLEEAGTQLVVQANLHGGDDNITVVLAQAE